MAGIEQVLNYVKNITETLNQWEANAKKTEELPVMETMDPLGLLIVSELVGGVWTSKKLEIQKIIDGISLSGQDNKVREVLLGTITTVHDFNYLLDNTGITVAENEIIVLTALTTINATLVQKQYLWKLGKGIYNPIGSANSNTKLIELQPRFLSEITVNELTSSPSAIVYDFGLITDSVLNVINAYNPAYNYANDEKIYYIRAIKDGVKLLYNFIGINGIYGSGASQMTASDLVLVYSSANNSIELLETKLDKDTYIGTAKTLDDRITQVNNKIQIVNDFVTGGATSLASAETVKTLKTQIDGINTLLASDNVNLDNVQELVDAIETVQTSLSSILVNDLTTGGTTRALTAEMGKTLQDNKVDKVAGERLINAAEITKLAGLGGDIAIYIEKFLADGIVNTFTIPIGAQAVNISIDRGIRYNGSEWTQTDNIITVLGDILPLDSDVYITGVIV